MVAVIAGLLAVLKARQNTGKPSDDRPVAKSPLTSSEKMFFKLIALELPGAIVLSQVSFAALITAKPYAVRNTFDRKMADFVLLDKSLEVVACIELDDGSHNGREKADAARDSLLTNAGYRVVRYPKRPTSEKLRTDFPNLV